MTADVPAVLRPGGVPREDLEDLLGFSLTAPTTSAVRVPGQHPSHYAPRARVVVVEPEELLTEAQRGDQAEQRVGVLVPPALADSTVEAHAVVRVPESTDAYARGLFGYLRELDEHGCDLILVSLPEEHGLGSAIANRLRRAAGPRGRT